MATSYVQLFEQVQWLMKFVMYEEHVVERGTAPPCTVSRLVSDSTRSVSVETTSALFDFIFVIVFFFIAEQQYHGS
jgi:hypothetical protein